MSTPCGEAQSKLFGALANAKNMTPMVFTPNPPLTASEPRSRRLLGWQFEAGWIILNQGQAQLVKLGAACQAARQISCLHPSTQADVTRSGLLASELLQSSPALRGSCAFHMPAYSLCTATQVPAASILSASNRNCWAKGDAHKNETGRISGMPPRRRPRPPTAKPLKTDDGLQHRCLLEYLEKTRRGISTAGWTGPVCPNATFKAPSHGSCSPFCLFRLDTDPGEHDDLAAGVITASGFTEACASRMPSPF